MKKVGLLLAAGLVTPVFLRRRGLITGLSVPRQLDRYVRQRHPAQRLTVALVVGVSVLTCTACDGYLGMTGFVYEDVSLDKPDEVRRKWPVRARRYGEAGLVRCHAFGVVPGVHPEHACLGARSIEAPRTVTMVRVN